MKAEDKMKDQEEIIPVGFDICPGCKELRSTTINGFRKHKCTKIKSIPISKIEDLIKELEEDPAHFTQDDIISKLEDLIK